MEKFKYDVFYYDFMSEEKSSSSSEGIFGFAGAGFGLAALIGIFTLGPIDLARTTYNSVVGDVPLIRERER